MTTNLNVFMANVKKSVLDQDHAIVGGGIFSPAELRRVIEDVSDLRRREINAVKEATALRDVNERLERDQKLLLAALKRYIDDPMGLDTKLGINAAYQHVTGA